MTNFEIDLLNRYIEKVDRIFSLFLKDFSESCPEHLKQIAQAADNLSDTWNQCLFQKATLKDFEDALNKLLW